MPDKPARLLTLQITLVPDTSESVFPDFIPFEVEKAIRTLNGVIEVRQIAQANIPDPRRRTPKVGPDFY